MFPLWTSGNYYSDANTFETDNADPRSIAVSPSVSHESVGQSIPTWFQSVPIVYLILLGLVKHFCQNSNSFSTLLSHVPLSPQAVPFCLISPWNPLPGLHGSAKLLRKQSRTRLNILRKSTEVFNSISHDLSSMGMTNNHNPGKCS